MLGDKRSRTWKLFASALVATGVVVAGAVMAWGAAEPRLSDTAPSADLARNTKSIARHDVFDGAWLWRRAAHIPRRVLIAPAPALTASPTPTATPESDPESETPIAEPVETPVQQPTATIPADRPFAATSPFNTLLGDSAVLDSNSARVISALTQDSAASNIVQYGVPIFEATASTPRKKVICTESWGTCPLAGLDIPLDDSFGPNEGSDGAMVVIDRAANRVYEFWRVRNSGGSWTTSWGDVIPLDGSGWGSTATGAGASRLGGVIRISELQAGLIPHALVLQTDMTCSSVFRAPAIKTDGLLSASTCIQEGSRIRLDPSIDLSRLQLSAAERTIATALQDYGAYVIDNAGTRLSLSFELASDATGSSTGAAYRALGLTGDYQRLKGIPWASTQLLSRWDGG